MKKNLFTFVLILCMGSFVHAQYVPNTKWPYLYNEFQSGTIFFKSNQKTESKLNVHLLASKLHYIKEGKIYEADTREVVRIEIGKDSFQDVDGRLMKIIAQKGENTLLYLTLGDFEKLLSTSGAYGSSSNTLAINDLSSLEIGGLNNPNHGLMLEERNEGRDVPLATKYYFIISGQTVPATRKEVEQILTEEQKVEWKKFLKENKIKWKECNSLSKILDFF